MDFKDIKELKDKALESANEEKDWYIAHAGKKRSVSKLLRVLAIIFVGLGTLCPLIESTDTIPEFVELSRWGYVAFAIAGIFIGYDRFFGISSGWIRYMLAIMALKKITNEFEYTWSNRILTFDQNKLETKDKEELLSLIQNFVLAINDIVTEETQNWAKEFESTLTELNRSALSSGG